MEERYLEVTFRKGKPIAAYFYLPRRSGDVSVRSERRERGLVVDFSADGRPIGIEITSPSSAGPQDILALVRHLKLEEPREEELTPLAG